jgi:hypothetical protein
MSPPRPSDPGFNTYFFASKIGWQLQPGVNLIVEGEHDVRYFRLADRISRETKGLKLLGDGFDVIAAGEGPNGGTFTIIEYFHQHFKNATLELGRDGEPVYRLAVLLDDDGPGRKAEQFLVTQHTNCALWRDVFRLQRRYPKNVRGDLKRLDKEMRELNREWNTLHCEIEDLFPKELVDLFCEENPRCFARPPEEKEGRWHFEFAMATKGSFCTFIEQSATRDDLQEMIELVTTLRFLLFVRPAEGSKV